MSTVGLANTAFLTGSQKEVCYIFGGGPSLRRLDWDKLLWVDKFIIAVNRAYEKLPSADIVYFSDYRFWMRHRASLLLHQGLKVTVAKELLKSVESGDIVRDDLDSTSVHAALWANPANHQQLHYHRITGTDGLDTTTGCLRSGNNSAYAALNLAVNLGFKKIYLLGVDMRFDEHGRSHWHNGYPEHNRESTYEKMAPYFSTAAAACALLGVRVFNASPLSTLTCFPKVSIEDALAGRETSIQQEAA